MRREGAREKKTEQAKEKGRVAEKGTAEEADGGKRPYARHSCDLCKISRATWMY